MSKGMVDIESHVFVLKKQVTDKGKRGQEWILWYWTGVRDISINSWFYLYITHTYECMYTHTGAEINTCKCM